MSAFLYPKKDFEVSLKTLVKIETNLPFVNLYSFNGTLHN